MRDLRAYFRAERIQEYAADALPPSGDEGCHDGFGLELVGGDFPGGAFAADGNGPETTALQVRLDALLREAYARGEPVDRANRELAREREWPAP
jgi:hypothetical protein